MTGPLRHTRGHIWADAALLIVAGLLQSACGGLAAQWAEGWQWAATLSIFEATVYPAPALAIFFGLSLLVRRTTPPHLSGAAAVGIVGAVAMPLLVLIAYAAFRIIGIDTLFFSVWAAALVLYITARFGALRLEPTQSVLALVPGWLLGLSVLVSIESRYELMAAMSADVFDPNAQLMGLLALMTLMAGAALAPWFVGRDVYAGSRWGRLFGLILAIGWVALVWANRVVIVPRLHPEIHGALAAFELVMLVGALGWLLRGSLEPEKAVLFKYGRRLTAASACVILAAAISTASPRADAVVPRHVDPTARTFSAPWLWVFDRDADGFLSEHLGGVDCAESNPGVHPLSREIRGDGIDQTCSGADLLRDRPPRAGVDNEGVDLAIVVTVDMLRPDFMQIYGAADQTTPFLDRSADEWTRFDRAYASGGITTLSLPSLLGGRIPLSLDLEPVLRTTEMRYVFPDERTDEVVNRIFASPRSDRHPTVGQVFQHAGRATYAVVDDGPAAIFQRGFGLERGFDEFSYPNLPDGPGEDAWGSRQVTDEAKQIISKAPEGSLLWLHYYDPHSATEQYCDAFAVTPGLGCYRDAIRHVDSMLAELVAHLRGTDRWERSLMVITSDHGEALGEHGLHHHGLDSYEEFVRIPLLLKSPGMELPRTSRTPVSLIDVATTLTAAAGLAPPATFQGDDLRRLAQGEARRHPVLSQMLITNLDGHPVRQQTLLVDGDIRYMFDRVTRRSWRFDLTDDPDQRRSLDTRPEYRRELLDLLDSLEARTPFSRDEKFP